MGVWIDRSSLGFMEVRAGGQHMGFYILLLTLVYVSNSSEEKVK